MIYEHSEKNSVLAHDDHIHDDDDDENLKELASSKLLHRLLKRLQSFHLSASSWHQPVTSSMNDFLWDPDVYLTTSYLPSPPTYILWWLARLV